VADPRQSGGGTLLSAEAGRNDGHRGRLIVATGNHMHDHMSGTALTWWHHNHKLPQNDLSKL